MDATSPEQNERTSRDAQPLIDDSREYPSADERAAARRAFHNLGSPFRDIFEHAAIGMAVVDLDGRFLRVNRSLCRIVGYEEAELLARDFQSITHPDDLDADLELAAKLMRGEIDHYDMEKRYFHRDGRTIWILLSASMVRDVEGRACYFVAQIQDITARKNAEAQLASRVRHLERLTITVPKILSALENASPDHACATLLRSVLEALDSEAGTVLRVEDETLVGCYIAPNEVRKLRCSPEERSELWNRALAKKQCFAENAPRNMHCGRRLTRSLVAPLVHDGVCLGLIHVGDAPLPYSDDDVDFIRRVSTMIAPVVRARIERAKLTPRESEIMDLIVSGMTLKQIAQSLDITIQTAAKHRSRVFDKLNVVNDVELVHLSAEIDPLRLAGIVVANPLLTLDRKA
ncbi:MAG: PAS domain S-box protein [Planctomycetota bacterium]|nr:MAG: PAS domain S-box protein [Planctomycetota bacterium]